MDQNESSGPIGRRPIIASACRAFAPQARLDGRANRSPNFDSFSVIAIDQSACRSPRLWDVQPSTGGGASQLAVSRYIAIQEGKQDDVKVYKRQVVLEAECLDRREHRSIQSIERPTQSPKQQIEAAYTRPLILAPATPFFVAGIDSMDGTTAGSSASDTTKHDTSMKAPAEIEYTRSQFQPSRCLFCNQASQDFGASTAHMQTAHGLFVPDQKKLVVDLETLFDYLHLVIFGYSECICCGTQRQSPHAAQQRKSRLEALTPSKMGRQADQRGRYA